MKQIDDDIFVSSRVILIALSCPPEHREGSLESVDYEILHSVQNDTVKKLITQAIVQLFENRRNNIYCQKDGYFKKMCTFVTVSEKHSINEKRIADEINT